MCELTAYLLKGSVRTRIMEDVVKVEVKGDLTSIISISGERKEMERVRMALIDQAAGTILFEPY